MDRNCKNCNKKSIIRDEITSNLVCAACGVEQQFDNFQTGRDDILGTYIRIGSSTGPTDCNYKELKIYHATQKIQDITSRLGFSASRVSDVKRMVEEVTEGGYGDGHWFPIFVGACCYVVTRKNNLPYSMADVGNEIGCDLHELGRMVSRVVDFLDLILPEFDIVLKFEYAINNCECFRSSRMGMDRMVKQGRLLLNCSVKWFLTTGRQPIPVVAAVLMFVAELNLVKGVSVEGLAEELHVGVGTCRKRVKELKEALVNVAQALPWGKNVNVKNIVMNAPLVIQYMEMKSRLKPGEKKKFSETGGFDLREMVHGCLQKQVEPEIDSQSYGHNEIGNGSAAARHDFDTAGISLERLSNIYTDFLSDSDFLKSVDEGGEDYRKKMRKDIGLPVCNKWSTGKSDLSKKLFLDEILEKDVGFNGLPPSFVAGELACKMRREKIKAAKQRIDEVMQPSSSLQGEKSDIILLKCTQDRKKGKRKIKVANIDWEDCIIETLLLRQVRGDEIEQGYYKRMLDLYVFDSERTCKIFPR